MMVFKLLLASIFAITVWAELYPLKKMESKRDLQTFNVTVIAN